MKPAPLLPFNGNPAPEVPPIVHLIWVGSDPGPAVEGSVRRWRELGTHEVKFWTEASIIGTPLERVRTHPITRQMPPRGVADLLRLYAVGFWGGWYMDVDLVPIRPLPMTPTIFSDSGYPNRVASNGAFGLPAGHPFLTEVLTRGVAALNRGVRNEHFTFGPRVHHEAFHATVGKHPIEFRPTIPTSATAAERRIQAEGGDFDMASLREKAREGIVVHITMGGSR